MLTREQIDNRLDEISRIISTLPRGSENSTLYQEQLERIKKAYMKQEPREVTYGNTL